MLQRGMRSFTILEHLVEMGWSRVETISARMPQLGGYYRRRERNISSICFELEKLGLLESRKGPRWNSDRYWRATPLGIKLVKSEES